MYVYNADSRTLHKFLNENLKVIVGIYEENCPISALFLGMLRQLRKTIKKDDIILMISKHEYMKAFNLSNIKICPKIILFKEGCAEKTIEGFKNYRQISETLTA